MSRERRREMTNRQHPALSTVRQCALLGISRSSVYYRPRATSLEDLAVMKLMDQQYLATPFYGSRRMTVWLQRQGRPMSRKRVQRLMRTMGLRAIFRRPRTSQPAAGHKVYLYLLGGMEITRPNQVWAADITYIPMARGFLYLVAIMDWYSRYVLSWRLSNTLDADFRFYNAQRPHQALGYRTPAEVFSCSSDTSPEQQTERGWSPGRALVHYSGAAGPSLNIAPILSN